jgi:ribokinase
MPRWGETMRAESVGLSAGGKALNQAIALARLGARVSVLGVVGDDSAGQLVRDTLVEEGVDCTGLRVRAGVPTPVCMCFVRADGQTAILWRVADQIALNSKDIDKSTVLDVGADALLATFEVPEQAVAQLVSLAARGGVRPLVHAAPPYPDHAFPALGAGRVTVVTLNEVEAQGLIGNAVLEPVDLADAVRARTGAELAVVTLGGQGCAASYPGGTLHLRGHSVAARDTLGAGDAFSAALTLALSAGWAVEPALRAASRVAAWTVSRSGGYMAMPHRGEPGIPDLLGPAGTQ